VILQVLALEAATDVVHIRVAGTDEEGSVIHHLPILGSKVGPDVVKRVADITTPVSETWAQISAWRELRDRGEAGAFALSVGDSISAICETVGPPEGRLEINSAYPVRSSDGTFSVVRAEVIASEGRGA